MSDTMKVKRDLSIRQEPGKKKAFLLSWEMILVYVLVFLNIALMVLESDIYFSYGTISFIIRSGMVTSFMVLGMTLVLLLGEIDVSVASIMVLSCMVTGLVCQAGGPDLIAVICGILTGALCGAFNGILIAKCGMSSVIVTIASSLLFRGIADVVLDGQALAQFPQWFSALAWRDIGGVIPYSMICFLVVAALFAVMLNKTTFGRKIYAIGNAEVTSRYSGIRVVRVKVAVYVIMGVMSAFSGILFAGRLGGITSGMGKGYELQVIAIALLGGVSTNGGKGNIFGPVVAIFIMTFLNKTLDLMGVHTNVQKIVMGIILLAVVSIPVIRQRRLARKRSAGGSVSK